MDAPKGINQVKLTQEGNFFTIVGLTIWTFLKIKIAFSKYYYSFVANQCIVTSDEQQIPWSSNSKFSAQIFIKIHQ